MSFVLTVVRIRQCTCFVSRKYHHSPFSRLPSLLYQINPNHLLEISSLNHDYCALRHGQSLANVDGVISSNPQVATVQHGLSDAGREQAMNAGKHLVSYIEENDYDGIVILSSDYKRAKETAEIVAECCSQQGSVPLYRDGVIVESRLRERWFGDWDGGTDAHYEDVWKGDALDPSHTIKQVESVESVMDRTTQCVLEWDANGIIPEHHLILLVAHGDVLQIMQTAFAKMDGSLHRTLQHLDTAKLRPLILAK